VTIQDTYTHAASVASSITDKFTNAAPTTDIADPSISADSETLWVGRSRTAELSSTSAQNRRGDETSTDIGSLSHRRTGELVVGLKKWAGVVREIGDGIFTAELTPLDHEGPQLLADFELRLLAPDDDNVEEGDVVYLTTRYVRSRSGYPTATTQIRLRRLGEWSSDQLSALREEAQRHAEELSRYAE